MKKKIIMSILVASMALSTVACADKKPVDTTKDNVVATSTPEVTPEPETIPTNDVGLENATISTLEDKVASKENFYLYVKSNEISSWNYDDINAAIKEVVDDYDVLVPFYFVDETILNDDEKDRLAKILEDKNIITDLVKDENATDENTMLEKEIETYSGFYAFEEGTIKNRFTSLVIGEEDKDTITSRLVKFVFMSDLFVNNHNIELISYEDVKAKMENGENFLLYVGRDTCPYCHAFMPSLETTLAKNKLNTNIYYLYTQSYKSAILNEEENAQETWDELKSTLGIEYTPSVIQFIDGKNATMFNDYIDGDTYYDATKEDQAVARDEVTTKFDAWLNEIGVVDNSETNIEATVESETSTETTTN